MATYNIQICLFIAFTGFKDSPRTTVSAEAMTWAPVCLVLLMAPMVALYFILAPIARDVSTAFGISTMTPAKMMLVKRAYFAAFLLSVKLITMTEGPWFKTLLNWQKWPGTYCITTILSSIVITSLFLVTALKQKKIDTNATNNDLIFGVCFVNLALAFSCWL